MIFITKLNLHIFKNQASPYKRMSIMKVIDFSMLDQVSGSGSGNDTSSRPNNTGSSRAHDSGRDAAAAAAAAAGAVIGGMVTGPGAPLGSIVGGVVGGVLGAGSFDAAWSATHDNNSGGGAFGGDSNANSVNGQCHW